MEQKERRALDKCFDSLLRDLDPSPSFLHSLYAENVITEEQMDKISKIPSRETQVAMLLRYLPHRGPNAFSVFKEKLDKDYPWISQKLAEELKRLKSGQESINKRLLDVLQKQMVPLVYSNDFITDVLDEKSHPAVIIQKLSDLVTNLEQKCRESLGMTSNKTETVPIHKLIDERLRAEHKKAVKENLDELSKEVKDLKKQLRDAVKLKGENEKLKTTIRKQKEKLRDYNKMSTELKRQKQDVEKFKKESEKLRYEVATLREQLRGDITEMFT